MQWAVAIAAFLASAVEFVEAFTIVLVTSVTINWRSSLIGALAAAVTLALIIAIFGVAIVQFIPIEILRLIVGILLILFGLKWLKKAILRYSGLRVCAERGHLGTGASQPGHHDPGHRKIDEGLTTGVRALKIAGKSTVARDPGIGPFHHPSVFEAHESLWE